MARHFTASVRMLAIAALSLAGCAANGQTWVQDAATPDAPVGEADPRLRTHLPAGRTAARREPRSVITLGQRIDPLGDVHQAGPVACSSPSSVSYVTNNYHGGYGYGYGYGYGIWSGSGWGPVRPDPGPQPERPSSTPPIGGDWPAPPSYGPPMISQTLPGNPWR